MNTCAYCGEIIEKDYYCPFCEMKLDRQHIIVDGKCESQLIEFMPDESALYQSTQNLLKEKTLNLFFILKYARASRKQAWDFKSVAFKTNDIDLRQNSVETYKEASRKQKVIETILSDRIGFVPERITDEFINQWFDLIEGRGQIKKLA